MTSFEEIMQKFLEYDTSTIRQIAGAIRSDASLDDQRALKIVLAGEGLEDKGSPNAHQGRCARPRLVLAGEVEDEGRSRPVAGKPEASAARSRPQLDSGKLSTVAEPARSEPETSPSSTAREDEELEEEKC